MLDLPTEWCHDALIMNEELQDILKIMDVPLKRMNDMEWLARNLGVRNREHKDFNRAMELILDSHPNCGMMHKEWKT